MIDTDAIRTRHGEAVCPGTPSLCRWCAERWPCDTIAAVEELANAMRWVAYHVEHTAHVEAALLVATARADQYCDDLSRVEALVADHEGTVLAHYVSAALRADQ